MRLPRSFSPLRQRAFARFWFGALVSNIGTFMETVGVGILVTKQTGQASWTGIVGAAGFVPMAFAGLIGGAFADRFARRKLLLLTFSSQAVLAGLLTGLTFAGLATPIPVTIIVFLSGTAGALGFPTFQSVLPDLVPPGDVPLATTLAGAQWNLGRVLGPALAGIVIAVGGYEWAFAINTVSFLAVLAAIAPMKLPPPIPHDRVPIHTSIAEGVGHVRRDGGLRALVTYLSCNALLAGPFIALVPAVALKVFDNGRVGTSVLVTAQGLGAVAAAVMVGGLYVRFGQRAVVLTTLFVLPAILIAYAAAPTLWLAAAAIFLVGGCYLMCMSGFTAIAQLRAPAALRGRVLSVSMVSLGLLFPLGSIVQGWIADSIGLRWTTAGAAVLLVLVVQGIRTLRPGFDREMRAEQELL